MSTLWKAMKRALMTPYNNERSPGALCSAPLGAATLGAAGVSEKESEEKEDGDTPRRKPMVTVPAAMSTRPVGC